MTTKQEDFNDTPWLVLDADGRLAAAYQERDSAELTAARLPIGATVQHWLDVGHAAEGVS